MFDMMALVQECAPTVAPQTMAAVMKVESSFNPFAIGVVGGRLERQPTSRAEAVATAKALAADGWNFSLGVAQINRDNLPKYSITYDQAFDPCVSVRVGSKILEECYVRAKQRTPEDDQAALRAAFSCYYSGNFTRGFKPDKTGGTSYVHKVLLASSAIPVVPAVAGRKPQFDKAAGAAQPLPPQRPMSTLQPQADAVRPAEPVVLAVPSLPPADHAPVLLSVGNDGVKLRYDAAPARSAIPGATTPAIEMAPAQPAPNPTIVF